jgi:peptidoglycan/LPS O-acetylase OafA/YrhL
MTRRLQTRYEDTHDNTITDSMNETNFIDLNDISNEESQLNISELTSTKVWLDPVTYPYGMVGPYEWSTSMGETNLSSLPLLTSSLCTKALAELFEGESKYDPNKYLLSVVVEASSHPAGIEALYAQPYVYAGGGLGNIDECPLMTCLAGAGGIEHRDSITFASVCMVPECSAYDLAAEDFIPTIQRILEAKHTSYRKSNPRFHHVSSRLTNPTWAKRQHQLGTEYANLLQRISEVNHFLKTGWTCGAFVVPWNPWPFGVTYIFFLSILVICFIVRYLHTRQEKKHLLRYDTVGASRFTVMNEHEVQTLVTESSHLIPNTGTISDGKANNKIQNDMVLEETNTRQMQDSPNLLLFLVAFDAGKHCRELIRQPNEDTRFLDGLRVGSLLWIVLGHTMAIESSSGGGYSNPSNFLPPNGITTTILGQLLFSSRLAVDTFLIISGYLVVNVMHVKFSSQPDTTRSSILSERDHHGSRTCSYRRTIVYSFQKYARYLPVLVLSRVGRIVPMYATCLGFFTQIAPHMGSGPFWHQWIGLLRPCHDYAWTNFLFINNFIPTNTAVTDTCFYHSWYLAVDMQLYILAPLLVFTYIGNKRAGLFLTGLCFGLSVVSTIYLSYSRGWSINTFDGASVGRYDMEGYAKPYIRGKSYFAGMLVAMMVLKRSNDDYLWISSRNRMITMIVSLLVMIFITFIPAFGAYDRRPCSYQEYPGKDYCGSIWSTLATFIFSGFSQTIWVISVSLMILMLALHGHCRDVSSTRVSCGLQQYQPPRNDTIILNILSWRCWTPLSKLSFGVYLIHPIVLFVWQLGDREKKIFRLLTFSMDCVSVCVVSYVIALLVFVLVECPCAIFWRSVMGITIKKQERQ